MCQPLVSNRTPQTLLLAKLSIRYAAFATTIEGFRCKARLADKLRDSDLAWSIVDDLQAMVAE
jgi:hypothetical protein